MTERSGSPRRPSGAAALGRLLLGHLAAFRNPRLQDVATGALRDGPGRAWVLAVVNATLRARRALAYACYLRPRTVLSRARFAAPAGAPAHRLSLLCPTRGRVRLIDTFLRSVQRTAAAPERVEVLCYVDDDDPDLDGYRTLFAAAARRYPRLGSCVLHVGPPVGVPAAWNALAAAAGGDLLLMANDDQLYVDYGWDARLDQRLHEVRAEHPDGVCCLYFEAGQYPDGAADFPILSRPWYEALGYFTPTIFQQWEVETWVFDLARRVDRLFAVPGVFVEHRHYQDYKAPFDATYQLHRMTREKSFTDHALFLRTTGSRKQDADALRRRIARGDAAPSVSDATGDGVTTGGGDAAAGDGGAVRGDAATAAAADFWFADYLRQHLPKIAAETAAVLREQPAQAWDAAALYREGRRDDGGCAVFPVTAGIVEAIPEATTFGRGVVGFARVVPGAALTAGNGGTARVLLLLARCDIPPTGSAEFHIGPTVDGSAGRLIVLDGNGAGEWRNTGAQDAIVLMLDVAAPEAAGGA